MTVRHANHLSDEHGTYSSTCSDCNTPWVQTVREILRIHRRSGKNCLHCRNGNGDSMPWPCVTARAVLFRLDPRQIWSVIPPMSPKEAHESYDLETLPAPDLSPIENKPVKMPGLCLERLNKKGTKTCQLFTIDNICVKHGVR